MNLGITATPVEFYGYREAFARDIFMEVDRTNDTIRTFEARAAKTLKRNPDNHTTYTIKTSNGIMIYVTCSDSTYYIGTSVEVKSW